MPEEFSEGEGFENLDRPPAFFPYNREDPEREAGEFGELIEVRVDGIYAQEEGGRISRFVLLADYRRKLRIEIGGFESQAIQLVLEGTRPDRPLTHDLLKNVLERLGGEVDRVVIDDFWNSVFYAKLYVSVEGQELEIDSRPSDAIALAVRFEAPIFVADALLDLDLAA
jgi:bifunctional DNase/RNase